MNTVIDNAALLAAAPAAPAAQTSDGVWAAAWKRLKSDPVGMVSLAVVLAFVALILAASLGLVAGNWAKEVGVPYANPSFMADRVNDEATMGAELAVKRAPPPSLAGIDPLEAKYAEWERRAAELATTEAPRAQSLPFGGDRWGRDVIAKGIKGSQVSIAVGLVAAIFATLIGTFLGAVAGYYGGRINDFLEWLYNVFTSIPDILLILSLAAVLRTGWLGKILSEGIWIVVIILAIIGWTGMYRQVRAEFMKHRSRDYVRAAQAIGASHAQRMFVHILPNVSHVILVRLSLLVVAFIKTEVILSFLGLGVPLDMVSWGTMLAEAQTELVIGKWWQLAVATAFMAVFLTAFSMLTDSLRDALDPKLR
ncbi:MAG: ABC transporter permease [Burkholderiaceae bacterium]